jgi:hypothetical protein
VRAADRTNGDFEGAARVVSRHLGERVVVHDDRSTNSMVDLEVHYADGRVGAVEVVTDTDEVVPLCTPRFGVVSSVSTRPRCGSTGRLSHPPGVTSVA